MKDVATKSPLAAEATLVRIRSGNEVLELNYDGAICQHPGSLWWGTAVAFRAMQAAEPRLHVRRDRPSGAGGA
jgi:hypothetical protein